MTMRNSALSLLNPNINKTTALATKLCFVAHVFPKLRFDSF
ncbi:MAG: hypothetical protein ACLFSQ_11570 [Candidatus Zixiibacteriota bacterium]